VLEVIVYFYVVRGHRVAARAIFIYHKGSVALKIQSAVAVSLCGRAPN